MGPGPGLLPLTLGDGQLNTDAARAVEPTCVTAATTPMRRRCSPTAKEKPEREGAGRLWRLPLEEKQSLPNEQEGTITIIPHTRLRTMGAWPVAGRPE
jgi:hypothetical protein